MTAPGSEAVDEHLWEVKHPYYCNLGNYYAREKVSDTYARWQDFIDEYADSDFDMNLVFRWDWIETDDEDKPTFNGDVYYRNGTLYIFWMCQRKGLYRWSEVSVCRADEPEVIKFLEPRWQHLIEMWNPIALKSRKATT